MGQPPVLIRPYEPPDLKPLVRLLREVRPDRLTTEVGFRYRLTALAGKDRRRLWVALVGDVLVGAASAQSVWWTRSTDTALVWAGVAASWRRLGIGSRLLDLAERHGCTIGATRLRCEVVLDDGRAFIGRRGYERGRSERVSALDPRTVDLSSLPRLERSAGEQGFRLASLAAAAGLEREPYDLDLAASRDIPADEEITFSLEDWRRDLWLDPEVDREASQVVLEGDRPVALAYLRVDREGRRAANEATGTACAVPPQRAGDARQARDDPLGGRARNRVDPHRQRRGEHRHAGDQPAARLRAPVRTRGMETAGRRSGNAFPASAGSTWAVTQTGVVTYRVE